MQWEHMTATEFASTARETGVCVIAMGVIEKHSEHLPLGTDFLSGHKIACLPSMFAGISWYADYPDHYAGDARPASAEKGRLLRNLQVDSLADFIAAVKADQVVPNLNREFFARASVLREGTKETGETGL